MLGDQSDHTQLGMGKHGCSVVLRGQSDYTLTKITATS